MYDALKDSKNAAAVWTLNQLGVETSKQYLTKLGIPLEDKGLAIALGGLKEGITPLQLAGAYRAFAENGENIQPYFIQEIKDQDGKVIAKLFPTLTKHFQNRRLGM